MIRAVPLALALALSACCSVGVHGTHDPAEFAGEYAATAQALAEAGYPATVPLDAITWVVYPSWDRFARERCGPACGGSAGCYTVYLPPLNADRCGWQHSPAWVGSERQVASIAHEILHLQGFEHGPEMDRLVERAWVVYAQEHCRDHV